MSDNPLDDSALGIRDAHSTDVGIIAQLNIKLAQETEAKTLDEAIVRRGVEIALSDPDKLRYWIAERGGRVIGISAISKEWSDWRCGWIWWIQSVYVIESERGRGVFRALFDAIKSASESAPDVIGLRLYVEQENERAQRTYQAVGLHPAGYHVFEQLRHN